MHDYRHSQGPESGSSANTIVMTSTVEVIIPVYNAPEFVERCICSLLEHAEGQVDFLLINDGSDDQTTDLLRRLASDKDNVRLIEHQENQGYTRAVNTGLRESTADYVILLNSDTEVSSGWIRRLVLCASSDPRIGIVGPLSNAASWQSVPEVKTGAKFATNPIPIGLTVQDVAEAVVRASKRAYPRTTFVNGFCFLIKRQLIDAIGVMDEENFPVGYGEENDYCMRARAAGFELAIADDVYVYHAKSKSFGDDRRTKHAEEGRHSLSRKYGVGVVEALTEGARDLPDLEVVRHAVDQLFREHYVNQASMVDPFALKLLFLLPVKGGGGGAHSVVQEASEMRRYGVDARVAVRPKDYKKYLRSYADILGVDELFVPCARENLLDVAGAFDIVIASVFTSVEQLDKIRAAYPEILPAYYVQDYEPMFFEGDTPLWRQARRSYQQIPGAFCFAKTRWIAREVFKHHGRLVRKVEPSLDHDVYWPAPAHGGAEVRVAAMVRPQTPRRGAERTMRVLRRLSNRYPGIIAVHIFGCESTSPEFEALPGDFRFINYGVLSRTAVASLLRRCDVFVDLSDYQAFGRTGLEAMASGCVVAVPRKGGSDEYAIDRVNAAVVETADEEECFARLCELIERPELRRKLRRGALETASRYSVQRAAMSELQLLTDALAVHRLSTPHLQRGHVILLPDRLESGAVASTGYVRLIQAWKCAPVLRQWQVSVNGTEGLPDPGVAELAILQSNASLGSPSELFRWLSEWRRAGGKLVLDTARDVGIPDLAIQDPVRVSQDIERLRWLASISDAAIAPSEAMATALRALNPHVFVVPTFFDAETWCGGHESPKASGNWTPGLGEPVRIGFIGTEAELLHLRTAAEPLRRILREYNGRVVFEVIGTFQNEVPTVGDRIGLPKARTYPEYVDWLHRRVNWDAALLPVDNGAGSYDPAQKFFHYSALRLATLAADTPACRAIIDDRRTGILVPNQSDGWYRALRDIIEDRERCQHLGRNAYAKVTSHYSVAANATLHFEVLQAIRDLPPRIDTPLDLGKKHVPSAPLVSLRLLGLSTQASEVGSETPPALIPHTGEARRDRLRRKAIKLLRDPEGFFSDSKSPLVRSLRGLAKR